MTDVIPFVRAWLASPLRVAAVAPSSPALAELITAEITPASAPVVELGPGTGVFTRALLARGVPEEKLALVEHSAEFARLLEDRFPAARILRMDAADLKSVDPFPGEAMGAIVSGLPLLSMPPKKIMATLKGALRLLRPGGAFYQFTYGLRCPVPRAIRERLGLRATRIGRILANVPPAAVYRLTQGSPGVRSGVLSSGSCSSPSSPPHSRTTVARSSLPTSPPE
jgi:phosphatidylethanolamine/phosphatidyl-N-methylethanolamine N-methyltransferase